MNYKTSSIPSFPRIVGGPSPRNSIDPINKTNSPNSEHFVLERTSHREVRGSSSFGRKVSDFQIR